MINRVLVPQGFENMEEATVGTWLKHEMDPVALGEPLCELITEKVTFQLPAEAAGVLLRVVTPENSIVPVGFIIAVIGEAGDIVPDVEAENASLAPPPAPPSPATREPSLPSPDDPTARQSSAAAGGSRIRATPAARRAARDLGVNLEDVASSLPGKVLSEDDVAKFAGAR